jgi:tellurite resistance protein TehA-like permease
VTVALLVLDLAWCVVLLAAEAVWPRLRFDVRRWSTVFPLGMTAATTLSVGTAMDVPGLRTPGQVMLWIAVAAWLVVAAGTVRYYVAATAAITSTEPR